MTMWVFGYGSLLWNPEFPIAQSEVATLHGFARSFCMRSIHHRGSEETPGLVLALDAQEDAHCKGLALRVEPGHEEATLAALRERELISSAYVERFLDVELASGEVVNAVVYVIDPHHVQYCHLELEEQARIIAHAVGGRGPNSEYLFNTAGHLDEIGLSDPDLSWLTERVRQILS
ncbi:gamma-glutamylcyclotransferase [Tritonibacter mobilis]|uniref:glutathione-specific gamma-glutamylcyclotransferase n=1 Tax=Tritonibacter mobilis F1926 TaxID=1265309 RepID=A0A1B0ZZP7_9RHOB|nr:gamma-glutamylcyclotransferase [Tritonibacter mobilis]ANP39802.1 gamma-glutamylcyclotransferase [Tritonibacter mobilis F1926]KJZ23972.1 gamma-glutamyl cyclotransferase [Tritonibacter mobilis]MBU3036423.1 gamma-glutamylcyclotransferase [Tritonibacter mobilis]WHQ83171.1 gamma-glutamylcyclotransferase [Tritonibacter mobilis]